MSNYYGYKEEAINLIPHYLIDIIQKTVKPSHLEKLQIIQNINKLMFYVIFMFSSHLGKLQIIQNISKVMFQVIFVFSDWILIEHIIVSSTPFVLGETDLRKIILGVLSGVLGYE